MPHGVLNQDGGFFQKECLVAGGHMVEAPKNLTFASFFQESQSGLP